MEAVEGRRRRPESAAGSFQEETITGADPILFIKCFCRTWPEDTDPLSLINIQVNSVQLIGADLDVMHYVYRSSNAQVKQSVCL